MVDLSEVGVGFRNYEHEAPPRVSLGQKIRFDVVTPYGRGNYQGTVAWTDSLEGGHAWGVLLVTPLGSDKGPLGSLLSAAFPKTE